MSEFEQKTNTNATTTPSTTTTSPTTHTPTPLSTTTTNTTSTTTPPITNATGLSSPVPRDTNRSILQADCSSHSSADSLLSSTLATANGSVSPVHPLLVPKRSSSISPTSSRKPVKVTKNGSNNSTISNTSATNITLGHTNSGKDGKKQKKKKNRCALDDCNNVANKLVGHCQFCDNSFCSTHRLLENHKCAELQTCKQQLHKRNADKLNREQTIVSKI
ncbi:hypothetical protein ACO0QE_004729 [Hanseniaspora vineae]